MNRNPETINELFIYIEGEFNRLQTEIENIKKFTYWVTGISGVSSMTVFLGVCKLVGII